MNISAPANFDFKLLPKLKGKVHDTYGGLNRDSAESVFPSYALPVISINKLRDYILYSHELGIRFNYIMNNPRFKLDNKRIRFLADLARIGVDMLTLSNPDSIIFVKKEFPFIICSSIACKIDTLEQALFFKDIGCDIICLDYSKNKDFIFINLVKKNTGVKIKLLVNNMCLSDCPYRAEHFEDKMLKGECFEKQFIKCIKIKLNDINLIRETGFIHPEDLKEYEKMGVDFVKLASRTKPTRWIKNCVDAYYYRKYKGNCFKIMNNSIIEGHSSGVINFALIFLPNAVIRKIAHLLFLFTHRLIFMLIYKERNVKAMLRICCAGEIFYMDKKDLYINAEKKKSLLKEINSVLSGV